MNIASAAEMYISKVIKDSEPGMKILLLDSETTSFVSLVYSHSEILTKEIYLIEKVDSLSTFPCGLRYLKCIAFLRPTEANIQRLCNELKNPRFGAYYLYFSNILSKEDVRLLATNDEQEVVKDVGEIYVDYLAIQANFFSLGIKTSASNLRWNSIALQRCVQGLSAVLLSLDINPIIRYQANSAMAKILGDNLQDMFKKETILSHCKKKKWLILLDRRNDPVTPLLHQWTYQAMVHELLGINNNRVHLPNLENNSKQAPEIVLNSKQDVFYSNNMYNNFGEFGQNIKVLIDEYQSKAKIHRNIENISDMKSFIDAYPQFKKLSGNVSKHIALIESLSSLVASYKLLSLSEIEQEIVSQENHVRHFQRVQQIVRDKTIRESDALKLVMLFALKYPKHFNDIEILKKLLIERGVDRERTERIQRLMKYGGKETLENNLLSLNVASNITKRLFKGLKGVDNIYTQHQPLLADILESLIKGKLKESEFPIMGNELMIENNEAIVFVIGGVTYEELLSTQMLKNNFPATNILLGGTTVHNSQSFMNELDYATRM